MIAAPMQVVYTPGRSKDTMPTITNGRTVLDQIIKEATETKQLDGLVIRIPQNSAAQLAPDMQTNGRNCNGVIAKYRGVDVIETARIGSFEEVEVTYDKKTKENRING
jgi:hypothetical protein